MGTPKILQLDTKLSRRRRRSTWMLMATVAFPGLLLGMGVVTAGPAGATALGTAPRVAAAGCYGDYCSGKDPHAMGCDNDAYDLASVAIPSTQAYVELRWSPSCKTEWARVPAGWGAYFPSQLRAVQPSTGYAQIGIVNSNAIYSWTRQIYSPVRCVYAAWVGPPGTISTWCV